MGIYYTKCAHVLEGYSDVNWISDSKDIKSTSGYIFTLNGGAISWKSMKHKKYYQIKDGSKISIIGCSKYSSRMASGIIFWNSHAWEVNSYCLNSLY